MPDPPQIQIPIQTNTNAQIHIPITENESHQLKIPVLGEDQEIEETNVESPYSRIDLKKLSIALDQTADRLLHGELSGLTFIGATLKAVNGITKSFAEEVIDRQKTGAAILGRISEIIPTGIDEDKTFTWKDPNTKQDFRFEIGTESTEEGDKRFLKAFLDNLDNKEVFCIAALIDKDEKLKSWRVEKNDFSMAQIDSLCKAEFPREKSKGLSR